MKRQKQANSYESFKLATRKIISSDLIKKLNSQEI
jgi:hypothetical protein